MDFILKISTIKIYVKHVIKNAKLVQVLQIMTVQNVQTKKFYYKEVVDNHVQMGNFLKKIF